MSSNSEQENIEVPPIGTTVTTSEENRKEVFKNVKN